VKRPLLAAFAATLAVGLAHAQQYPTGYGPDPVLPKPEKSLLPTVNVAKAVPWPEGTAPVAAAGLRATPYATGLQHPRWVYVLPNGDVLVRPRKPRASGKP
jgi:glucose/arabinose dehydrogenase